MVGRSSRTNVIGRDFTGPEHPVGALSAIRIPPSFFVGDTRVEIALRLAYRSGKLRTGSLQGLVPGYGRSTRSGVRLRQPRCCQVRTSGPT